MPDFEPQSVTEAVRSLLIAFALALPIAWNRQKGPRRMGLRTFPLVAVASCSYVMVGLTISGGSPEALSRSSRG